ncbi:MAG: MbnP family copper-binding protein [Candidatus Binatia bacterium]
MKYFGSLALGAALLAAHPAAADEELPAGLDNNGQCVGDANGDATILINEIIQAVNNALSGCPRRPVAIEFRAMVGDEAFACSTAYDGIGTASSQFVPADWRMFVHDLRLVAPDGTEAPVELVQDEAWQYQNVALLDFEDGSGPCQAFGNAETNTMVRGSVPAGVYTGIKFRLGLPFDLNHGNASTAPAPLGTTAMFWNWQSGYKFLRIDTADDKFRIHLGSTGCDGPGPSRPPDSCAAPNRAAIALSGFDPQRAVVVADLRALLAESNVDANEPDTPPGCMSGPLDDDCAPLFRALGLSFPEGQPTDDQQFFRVASKEEHQSAHVEILVGSSSHGRGTLVALPQFDIEQPIPLFFDTCFDGVGVNCDSGTRLFSAVNPGFTAIQNNEPSPPAHPLADGTAIELHLDAVSDGLSFKLGDAILAQPGDRALLGEGATFHADVETQLTLPGGGAPSGTYSATFRLITGTAPYSSSDTPFTLHFTPLRSGHAD